MTEDSDGDIPQPSTTLNRHHAWAWDEAKRFVYKGQQKARPLYRPTLWQRFADPYERTKLFGDPMKIVAIMVTSLEMHVAAKAKAKEESKNIIVAQHDEKHRIVGRRRTKNEFADFSLGPSAYFQ